ncbi:MAG TPA: hypothetical protein VL281_10410 [Mycobacteriales bacterium]|nr:hypothetical protein [Mycobacteriales bacterium]
MRPLRPLLAASGLLAAALLVPGALAGPVHLDPRLTVTRAVHHDTSAPLAELALGRPVLTPGRVVPEAGRRAMPFRPGLVDTAAQTAATLPPRATVVHSYTGLGDGFDPSYSVEAIPPDTVGAAGRTQYVQWVNSSLAVLDKATGAHLLGPVAGKTLFKGFGGECEKENDGDPVVNYDRQARRWVLQQFAITNGNYECIAVSTTENALGRYHRYAFKYAGFNDYPKAGVWSHSYVDTYNMFNAETGTKVCAFDRAAMLRGRDAAQQCFQLDDTAPALLPADVDGTRFPGAKEDVPLLGLGTVEGVPGLAVYELHVDWARPHLSRLRAAQGVRTAPYNPACGVLYEVANRRAAPCAPQPLTGLVGQVALVGLDVLSDRPMFRLAWRRFADGHDAMTVTHAVDALPTAAVGLRWYELRRTRGGWSVHQQGTYVPDGDSRWMGSAAMDKNGGIGIGYSVSGPTLTFPSIRVVGRTAADPQGELGQETHVVDGLGEQLTASDVARWGDYSAMSVDPVDDCTFWYTTQYMATFGVFDWSTKVVAFRLPGC